MAENPYAQDDLYAPPVSDEEVAAIPEDLEEDELVAIRRAHLKREGAIVAIGHLNLLWGVVAILSLTVSAYVGFEFSSDLSAMLYSGSQGVVAVLMIAAWRPLTRLNPLGRTLYTASILITLMADVGMAAAAGTFTWADAAGWIIGYSILTALVLVLWTSPAVMVFSARYRDEVVPNTQSLKPPMPWWFYVLLVLHLLVLVAVLVGVFTVLGLDN